MRKRVTPNLVTLFYGLGGICFSIPNIYFNLFGVIIFFSKGILDWSDGHLAILKYYPTLTGHLLDIYGARLNSISLTIGLGFFTFHQTGIHFF